MRRSEYRILRRTGVKFISENCDGAGVRLKKQRRKSEPSGSRHHGRHIDFEIKSLCMARVSVTLASRATSFQNRDRQGLDMAARVHGSARTDVAVPPTRYGPQGLDQVNSSNGGTARGATAPPMQFGGLANLQTKAAGRVGYPTTPPAPRPSRQDTTVHVARRGILPPSTKFASSLSAKLSSYSAAPSGRTEASPPPTRFGPRQPITAKAGSGALPRPIKSDRPPATIGSPPLPPPRSTVQARFNGPPSRVIQMGPKPDWYTGTWNVLGVKRYCAERAVEGDWVRAFGALDAWNAGRQPSAQIAELDAGLDPANRPSNTTSTAVRLFGDADFQAGDLIYGLSAHRDVLAGRLQTQHPFLIVDDLNAHFLGVLSGQNYGVSNNPNQASAGAAGHYKSALEEYQDLRGKPITSTGGGGGDVNIRLRRSSKFGVRWAAQSGRRIHFNLDNIVMDEVVNKNRAGEDSPAALGRPKQRAITGAELRFVYRNWNQLRDRVVFYRNRQVVPPPWESEPLLWARYQPRGGSAIPTAVTDAAQALLDHTRTNGPPGRSVTTRQRSLTLGQGAFVFQFVNEVRYSDGTGPFLEWYDAAISAQGHVLYCNLLQ
jgi:hypothetical protein